VFESHDPKRIAASLKHSAEQSRRRKATLFQSAMSILTFFMNRASEAHPASQKRVLNEAKVELRRTFGRPAK
jgi:polyhydroxyalkanoate synthesis regulator protein